MTLELAARSVNGRVKQKRHVESHSVAMSCALEARDADEHEQTDEDLCRMPQ